MKHITCGSCEERSFEPTEDKLCPRCFSGNWVFGDLEKDDGDSLYCPSCEEKMEYKEKNDTHVWICPDCPFIVFEYYNKGDIDNLYQILN